MFLAPPRLAAAACLGLLLSPALAATGDRTARGTGDLRAMYDDLRRVELDTSRSARLDHFVIRKDIATITLASGRLWFAKPWREGEKPTGAWFEGEGRVQMTPPTATEKDFLKKQIDRDTIDQPFPRAFIRFTDDLWDRLRETIVPETGDGAEAAGRFAERQRLLEELNFNVEFPILAERLSRTPPAPTFLFEFEMPKEGWVTFYYDPSAVEESAWFRHKKVGLGEFQSVAVLTIYHDRADYESGRDLGHDDKDPIWIRHYEGEITIDRSGMLLRPKLDVEIEARADGVGAAVVALMSYWGDEKHPFVLEKVTDASGTPLEFMHRNHQLLIAFHHQLGPNERTTVHLEYTADYIRPDRGIGDIPDTVPPGQKEMLEAKLQPLKQEGATFTLLNTYPWYPMAGYLKRATFDWTIRVPVPFLAAASGTTLRRWTEEGYNCLHTAERVPVALTSVLFGRYVMASDTSEKPAIYVYTLDKQQKQAEGMLAEARAIIRQYQDWFGAYPFEELDVAQMGFFYGFGQAPPGLVQLTGEAFLPAAQIHDIFDTLGAARVNPSFIRAFVAHEIGHEWWGHAVSWANLHDQWLSESYTEYCSALYVQLVDGTPAFEEKLRQWRDRAARTKDAGPIWLGQRLGKSYFDQTYFKGPYVVHMMRLALQAQAVAAGKTVADGDRQFFAALRAFIEKFRNQNATTTDLQQVVKKTTLTDMDWFFDQWFRGDHWLKIVFHYQVEPTEDGKYLLKATLRQPDKDHVKQMTVPLSIHFGKDQVIQRMILLSRQEQVVQIKLPKAPEKVILDEHHDLLAEIETD